MRFVRFYEIEPLEDYGEARPRWGVLVDSYIFPCAGSPWQLEAGAEWRPQLAAGEAALALGEVRLLAPVTPGKIVCVGRNYAEHAAELGNEVPKEPLLFLKPPSSVVSTGDAVVYPSISQRVDHEAELAVVIGSRCRFVAEEQAMAHVFAYTVANDVTARDLQKSDGQWSRAKGFDTFCPVGPWLDTTFDPTNRIVRCTVNGTVRQEASTSAMIFSLARILSHISQAMTLEPGDLVLTGTPSGIGPVQPGDVMSAEIEGLGTIQNPVISEAEHRAHT
jgi:2-keto-4-pentenoate hydratase/2-oxohepta-3-ene-1,7-dioic acid hydratase in catechol pathway